MVRGMSVRGTVARGCAPEPDAADLVRRGRRPERRPGAGRLPAGGGASAGPRAQVRRMGRVGLQHQRAGPASCVALRCDDGEAGAGDRRVEAAVEDIVGDRGLDRPHDRPPHRRADPPTRAGPLEDADRASRREGAGGALAAARSAAPRRARGGRRRARRGRTARRAVRRARRRRRTSPRAPAVGRPPASRVRRRARRRRRRPRGGGASRARCHSPAPTPVPDVRARGGRRTSVACDRCRSGATARRSARRTSWRRGGGDTPASAWAGGFGPSS